MRLGVNGRFLAAPRGGVRRFAEEITGRVLAEVGGVVLLPGGVGSSTDRPGPLDVLLREPSTEADGGARRAAGPSPGVEVRRGRLCGHLWEQVELPGAARRAGCDVVLHLANTAPFRGGPHVAVVHDVTPLTHPGWFRRPYSVWHGRVERAALRRAAAILTVSEWSAVEVGRALDVPAHRVRTVAQGAAPLDAPAAPEEVDELRRRLGLREPYLLAVGARDPRKNVAFLAGVVERLRAGGLACRLVLVGGRHPGRVWADPPAPSAGAGVMSVGEVDDATLRGLYTGAAALAHPALAEGFGRPPLEAMACGAPVVAAPYGPAREVLGDAAEIVPLEEDAWVAALERLLREPEELRARRVERGRRRAARHRWEDGVRRVLEVCRAVASGREGVRPGTGGEGES